MNGWMMSGFAGGTVQKACSGSATCIGKLKSGAANCAATPGRTCTKMILLLYALPSKAFYLSLTYLLGLEKL
jgi:hypothetical protein